MAQYYIILVFVLCTGPDDVLVNLKNVAYACEGEYIYV
jgi:hypothetical protein